MADYNQNTKSWAINCNKNGFIDLFLSEITDDDISLKYNFDTTPTEEHFKNIDNIIQNIYEPICFNYSNKLPIIPSYFNFDLIQYLQIDNTNPHCYGQAIDISVNEMGRNITNRDLFDFIKKNLLFDQLIWELGNDTQPKWVHIGYIEETNRGEILILKDYGQKFQLMEIQPTIIGGLTVN